MKTSILKIFAILALITSCADNDLLVEDNASDNPSNQRLLTNKNVELVLAEDVMVGSNPFGICNNGLTEGVITCDEEYHDGKYQTFCRFEPYFYSDKTRRRFLVKVKNLGFNKKVYIHHQSLESKNWKDYELKYVKSENGEDYFGTTIEYFRPEYFMDGENNKFAIKYIVNGKTYWDNNSGKNYSITKVSSYDYFLYNNVDKECDVTDAHLFNGDANIGTMDDSLEEGKYLKIELLFKNIINKKDVRVVYTTDYWKTNKVLLLKKSHENFGYGYYGGYAKLLNDPKLFKEVEFAIVYKENNVEKWDNNGGKNYKFSKSFTLFPRLN